MPLIHCNIEVETLGTLLTFAVNGATSCSFTLLIQKNYLNEIVVNTYFKKYKPFLIENISD